MPGVLQAVWALSIAMAALSCGVMTALIVARFVRQQRDRDLPARSVQLTLDFLGYGKGGTDLPHLHAGNRHDRDLIMKTALDVSRALDDEGCRRLVRLLRGASLDAYYRRAAVRGHVPDRVAAIELLRLFRDPETVGTLKRLEGSPSFRICVAAFRTRLEIGDSPDLASVLALIERPQGGRSLSLFKIVESCTHANLPIALALLAAGLPREAQVMVLKAIGTSRSSMALTAITRSANDMDPEVRAASITALRALGAPGITPWFVAALHDFDWRVRLKAVEGLGQYGEAKDRASIEPLLNDSVWWIRLRAGEALQRLEKPKAAPSAAGKLGRVRKPGLKAVAKKSIPPKVRVGASTKGALAKTVAIATAKPREPRRRPSEGRQRAAS